jgi:hypothetical protein
MAGPRAGRGRGPRPRLGRGRGGCAGQGGARTGVGRAMAGGEREGKSRQAGAALGR